ncbi:hypothetical protein H6G41_20005 [Tolypothrix sp. FACHB-123]|uniref:hypothetical protein n=1 Tax=Tolypothrix sp. FACHB-123 TaxID=2692868 RepID=UPI001688445D|nr:hypothetical protein [Tolypothrix sp. FACHB-123]MBD2356881.1 hypothetical protein [Tolypothrix sp. FACHB-123]
MKSSVVIDTCALIHLMYIQRFYLLKELGYSVITTIYVQLEFENERAISKDYFCNLVSNHEISLYPLEIDDLVEMANIPQSKKASDAELSCFVVAKRIGGKAMTDDYTAIDYIQRHVSMPPGSIITLFDMLFEAYLSYWVLDYDLRDIQAKLSAKKFNFQYEDIATECAKRRWIAGE